MKDTLEIINRMQADGVIDKYAIGGAVGATLYLEPSATLDVDVFVLLPGVSNSQLVSLEPIYRYLVALGGEPKREHIVIGAWPVQFLTPANALEREALDGALQTQIEGVTTWVMTAEHLLAIALRTGRPKDHARILQFMELNAVDRDKMSRIFDRHGLTSRWEQFRERYLDE